MAHRVLGLDEPRLGGDGQRHSPLGQVVAGLRQQRADDLLEAAQVLAARAEVGAAQVSLHVGLHELDQFQPGAAFAELPAHPVVCLVLGQLGDECEAAPDAVEPPRVVLDGGDQFFVRLPGGVVVGRAGFAQPTLGEQLGPHLECPVVVALRHELQREHGQ